MYYKLFVNLELSHQSLKLTLPRVEPCVSGQLGISQNAIKCSNNTEK